MAQPNIVLIVLDTLRRDHLGCYGYGRGTSPAIDRLASEGTTYDYSFASHFPTIPLFTTLYTGTDAIDHHIVKQGPGGPVLSPKTQVLAEWLRRGGYVTGAVDNLVTLRHPGLPGWFARGFDHYLGFRYDPAETTMSEFITDRGIALMREMRGSPFFLMMHYWDTHTPYWPPEDPYGLPAERPGETPLVERFRAAGDEFTSLIVQSMLMERVTHYDYVVSQYDAALRFADEQIGRLIAFLDGEGLRDDTLVIFMADHGECFGELDVHFEHASPADANIWTPLVMRWPGKLAAGARDARMLSTPDITATILAAAGVEQPSQVIGTNLHGAHPGREFIVSAECSRQANWILRTRDYKLVRPTIDARTGKPHPDLYGKPRGKATLHDVRDAKREAIDVADAQPEIARELLARLEGWLTERRRGRPDPLELQHPITYDDYIAFWKKIISRMGPNPTREKFSAAHSLGKKNIVTG
jgi:arylsulfatase A-like enzyme